ncbi:hypothetical protein [Aliivibrio logei]|uniref:hypothetical protein n=1 Tax=Aliivibrio logei TaxID=688 RepID=UPI0035C8D819
MNIKKILLPLLFTLLGYSFNAYSAIRLAKGGYNTNLVTACTGVAIGVTFDSSKIKGCLEETITVGSDEYYVISEIMGSSPYVYVRDNSSGRKISGEITSSPSTCSPPKKINPDTGICENGPPEPSFCDSPPVNQLREENKMSCALQNGKYSEECNNETETYTPHCEVDTPPPGDFCDSQAVSDMKSEGLKSCTAQGGSYSFQCNNDTESFSDSCDNIPPEPPEPPPECVPSQDNNWCDNPPPDKCVIGSPSWPQCEPWYDEDPTSPLDPVNPPKPGPINPSVPKPVDPTPSPSPNPDGSFNDRGVIRAINDLNLDMNFGFSDINNALQLQTNILSNNNDLIVHGLQQDLAIYENNKLLQLNNTESIVNAIGAIPADVPFDDSGIIAAIGKIPSNEPYDDSNVIDAINALGEKLDGSEHIPCEPTPDNNYCESFHGLDSGYTASLFGELSSKMTTEISAADSSILGAAADLVAKPPVDESTVTPFFDMNISILTGNDTCVAMNWYGHELSCEFSDNFKSIFGFLLFMYTLHTVLGILMEDITPNQKSYSHRRR